MPEAIATTKRKFHKLLDTFTAYANAAALPDEPTTPLTAREKLAIASERVRKRQRNDDGSFTTLERRLTSTQSLPRRSPARRVTATRQDRGDPSLPSFSPWSQESFLQRLQSFSSVSLWHPKPESINEVAWAKRGWSCIDVNTVCCINGCNKRVVVAADVRAKLTVGKDENEDPNGTDFSVNDDVLQQSLAARYQQEIINGHGMNCLWRKTGCKDDIYRLQLVRPAIWQPAIKDRYSSLMPMSVSIKDVAIQPAADQRSANDILSALVPAVLPDSAVSQEQQTKLLQVALYGWRGSSELGANLLKCDACFQRVGLWMYQPDYRPRSMNADEEQAPSLHLLEMHREYCPWRNSSSQQASGSFAGLNAQEILERVIATNVRERRRKTEDDAEPEIVNANAVIPVATSKPSREEVEQQDRERESKLQKLKRLLSVKRTSQAVARPVTKS